MEQLLQMLGQQLGGDPIRQLSGRMGTDSNTTASAVAAALPMLLTGIGQHAAQSGGLDGLMSMLDRDHDGQILDDLAGFFGKGASSNAAGSILSQILGDRSTAVSGAVERASGLGGAQVSQLLAMLAPVVLSFLARTFGGGRAPAGAGAGAGAQGGGIDLGGLIGALTGGGGGGGLGGLIGGMLGGGGAQRGGQAGGGLGDVLGGLLGGGSQASAARAPQAQQQDDSSLDELAAAGAKILGGLLRG